jgi:uncharacterized protein (TIGR02246 family)
MGARLLAVLVLAAGLLPGVTCGHPEAGKTDPGADPGDLQAIQRLREAFVKAHNDGDADRLAELFTDDAVLVPADEADCEGREEIAGYFSDFLALESSTLEFNVRETRITGDWAFERIDATLTLSDSTTGEEYDVWARYFWILERQPGGSWKIARAITNIDESDPGDEGPGFQPQT